jgi:voltage-gated potassium channel
MSEPGAAVAETLPRPAPVPWHRRMRRARRKAGRAFAMLGGQSPADERAEGPRVAAWQQRTEWPLAILAVLFLAAYAMQVLARGLDPTWRRLVNGGVWTIWALFVVEFVVRVSLARRHTRYVWRHSADVAIIALPMLRPLRVLRVILLMRMLNRRLADQLRGRVVVYGAFTAVLLIFCASLAVLQAERGHPGANIETFGDALWWSIVTICTVGYGDNFPVTVEGRFVGAGLMISGVGLFGVVTASFAAWLVDQLRDEEAENQQTTRADIDSLRAQLDRIEARLEALGPATPPPPRRKPARRKG